MNRSVAFYNAVFACELYVTAIGGAGMAWFPWEETAKGAGGSLILSSDNQPS